MSDGPLGTWAQEPKGTRACAREPWIHVPTGRRVQGSMGPSPWAQFALCGLGPIAYWTLVPVPVPRSPVPCPWSLVPGPWSLVPGTWYLVPSTWYLVPGT